MNKTFEYYHNKIERKILESKLRNIPITLFKQVIKEENE